MSCNAGPSASYSSGPIPHVNSTGISMTDCFIGAEACAKPPELKDGCTVEGYSTGQNFSTVYIDLEETYTSLKIFLQGFEEEKKPVKVRTKKVEQADILEDENEELRRQIAELENEKLKKQLEDLKKPAKKKVAKKTASPYEPKPLATKKKRATRPKGSSPYDAGATPVFE